MLKYLISVWSLVFIVYPLTTDAQKPSPKSSGKIEVVYHFGVLANILYSGTLTYYYQPGCLKRELVGAWLNKGEKVGIIIKDEQIVLYASNGKEKRYIRFNRASYLAYLQNLAEPDLADPNPLRYGFSPWYFEFRHSPPRDARRTTRYGEMQCATATIEHAARRITIEHTAEIAIAPDLLRYAEIYYPAGLGFPYKVSIAQRGQPFVPVTPKNRLDRILNQVLEKLDRFDTLEIIVKSVQNSTIDPAEFDPPQDYRQAQTVAEVFNVLEVDRSGDDWWD